MTAQQTPAQVAAIEINRGRPAKPGDELFPVELRIASIIDNRTAAPRPTAVKIKGEIVEAGSDADGNPRLIVSVTLADLRALPCNIVFREVEVVIPPTDPQA